MDLKSADDTEEPQRPDQPRQSASGTEFLTYTSLDLEARPDGVVRAIESRVLLIMTGGTISMKKSPNGYIPARGFLESCLVPRPSFNDGSNPIPIEVVANLGGKERLRSLRTPLSQYGRHVRYAVLEFDELFDSSSIDAKGWIQIAKTVHSNYKLFDAFVVLHGTDSLAYTSSALSFMLQNLGNPVVLTGSQIPMLELQTDAHDNLLNALVIAGHFMIPEVCLFFHYKLFRGNRAVKVSADDFEAFASPNCPPLATVSSSKINVAWELVCRPTRIEPFNIQTKLDTAHVACLRIFPGIKPEMVDVVLRVTGLRGLILETFGPGNAPGGPDSIMTRIYGDAVQRGIVIVNVTQCLTGSVRLAYEPAILLGRAGVVPGLDMTSEAALTKLSYLLGLPNWTIEEVTNQMTCSLIGELTENAQMTFKHPLGAATKRELLQFTGMAYAIASGDVDEVDQILEVAKGPFINDADYTGNTPLHVAATGPSSKILQKLLLKGASVHLRNHAGRTPLFLAANANLPYHVELLRASGAHLHANELSVARLHSQQNPIIWEAAGAF